MDPAPLVTPLEDELVNFSNSWQLFARMLSPHERRTVAGLIRSAGQQLRAATRLTAALADAADEHDGAPANGRAVRRHV